MQERGVPGAELGGVQVGGAPAAEGYRIRGNVGDQWSDLQGDCAGDRVFKVPNPMQAAAAAKRTRDAGDVVHDYRSAVFPFYEKWRNEYGPVFTYSVGNMVFLHASDPAVVRDVCLSVSPDELGKSSYMKVTHHPLFGDGILKSNGDAWARQRKLIAPEFFPEKVKGMVDLMVDSARALVRSWEARVAGTDGGVLELTVDDDLRAYSGDVISRTCFGSSYVKGKRIFAMIRELQKTLHSYLPFGAGARTCLGQGFAMAELKVLLSLLLFRFEAALSPDYLHSPVLRLTVEPEHGVRLVLRSVRPDGSS
ncbi:unnamed protein product [Triticum turgidum subsp. durum]|uniref:Cytochrome P450 n=1 Tax=Triticum turgidum subsp. durum TaxID=4567 RepID=A0A9R1R306_TRITD|nr:unnamed protein product [Triticum turgidum subsp. durum]